MHVSQMMITVLGLCLFQAGVIVADLPAEEAIKSFVELVTEPDATSLQSLPVFSKIADSLQEQHSLKPQTFHQDLIGVISHDPAPYILNSVMSYHNTLAIPVSAEHLHVKAERLQIYRDAIYSELVRLANQKPEDLDAHPLSHKLLEWLTKINNHSSRQASLQHIFEQTQSHFANSATSKSPIKFNMLTRDQVKKNLQATTVAGVPDAPLVGATLDPLILQTILHHGPHHHQPPAFQPNARPAVAVA